VRGWEGGVTATSMAGQAEVILANNRLGQVKIWSKCQTREPFIYPQPYPLSLVLFIYGPTAISLVGFKIRRWQKLARKRSNVCRGRQTN
jgi:hypothetical protein